MMYDLNLAWRNIRHRLIQTFIPILVVALAIALSVAVFVLADGAEEGIVQASDPFGVLVVGKAGSGQELVLSSILLQGVPIGNIDYAVYEQLENDERVRLAVPLGFGDSVGGARIIGTNHNFFELRRSQLDDPAFQLAEGRLFSEVIHNDHEDVDHADKEGEHEDEEHEDHADEESEHKDEDADHTNKEGEHEEDDHEDHAFEAVLGSSAAQRLGLNIGDQFRATHGVGRGIAENEHEDVYTIVGILHPTGTAYDTAVYTTLESIWDAHAHDEEPNDGRPTVTDLQAQELASAAEEGQVTSILVLPNGFVEQNQIVQEFYIDPTLQAAFPGDELVSLINLLNQGQQVLNVIGYLVLGIASLTLFLSMYSAILTRQQSIAIMRSLGSSRLSVFRVVIFETLIVSITGAILGRIIGYGLAFSIASAYSQQSAILIPVRFLPELEMLLWVMAISVGILAGIIPAILAYRVNVVEKLFPS